MHFFNSVQLRIACAVLIGATPLFAATTPNAPDSDPFYSPPSGFASKAPGTLLKSRTITAAFSDPNASYQLLYRTTAIDGSAIAAVTTIFVPKTPLRDRFVSFHTAYDSSNNTCNPSYQYQQGAPQTDLILNAEEMILSMYLKKNYIVSSPDYEGPDAAFGAGRLAGMGVLDSMRAVSSFTTLGFTTKTPAIAGVGYSGGGIATGWAASLHPTYAPELPIKGWSSGGTPANLTGTTVFADGTLFSGFILAAIAGLLKPTAYGAQLSPLLNSIITPLGRTELDFANTHCAIADVANASFQSILSTKYQSEGPRLLYDPVVAPVLRQNIMGLVKKETPIAPVYLFHASGDEIIPYANATTLYDSWCRNGASVTFKTYSVGGHATTEFAGATDALNFVVSAFAGTVKSGCTQVKSRRDTVNTDALGPEFKPLLTRLDEKRSLLDSE